MNVIVIFWACLILTAVLTLVIFAREHRRLAAASQEADWNEDKLQALFSPNVVERGLGYVLLALLALLIWQTIRQSFDFALLLVVATVVTGVIYLADILILRPYRRRVLSAAESSIEDFDATAAELNTEPGLIENSRSFFPVLLLVFVLRSFLFEPFQIPSGSMKPTLEIGDFILVNRFIYGLRMPVTNDVLIPFKEPQRGDVIVFRPPHEPETNYIKRVIGVPGDRIQYDYARRILTINGQPVPTEFQGRDSDSEGRYLLYTEHLPSESSDGVVDHRIYLNQSGPARNAPEWLPPEGVVVPEGKYFAMGDNRDNSFDSRYWEGQRRLVQGDFANSGHNAWGFLDEDAILGQAIGIWMHWEGWYPSFSRLGGIE